MKRTATIKAVAVAILLAITVSFAGMAAESVTAKVDINKATVEQLQTLPGVGEVIAKRIVEYRQTNGSFEKAADIMNVKGIGEKSYLKMKDRISVSEVKAVKK